MKWRIGCKLSRVSLMAFAILCAHMLFAGDDQAAHKHRQCSNATLNGTYGLHATGTVIGVGDFAAVGRFTFDGKGHLTGKLFVRTWDER